MKLYYLIPFLFFTFADFSHAKFITSMTDDNITTSIQARLSADRGLHYKNIDVNTYERVVILSGNVDNETQRRIVICIARSTPDVKGVISRLRIQRFF